MLRSASPVPGRRVECVMSMQPQPWPQPAQEIVVAVRAMYARRRAPLPVQVRDQLGELFADGQFAAAFGVRGKPGWPPGRLALVTVLQMAEALSGRQAAEAVRDKISWKHALGLGLGDPGFDASVLSEFRTRVVTHGLEERVLDLLLAVLKDKGLVKAGGRQRTGSTHVAAAVRDLNRLELAGESVRACLEALAVAAPGWLAATVDVAGWGVRYGRRVGSWRLPASKARRAELATAYGQDGFTLLAAVYAADVPGWLRELPAVQVLRVVLLQNYTRTVTSGGREVVGRREAETDGLPPGGLRLASPYDTDARWGSRRDTFWNGYKVHLSETCDPPGTDTDTAGAGQGQAAPPRQATWLPNIITNVATTDATVPDQAMTQPVHRQLAGLGLLPGEHYLDSGYPSAELLVGSAATFGIALVTPVLADTSPQARAGAGLDRTAFRIDWDRKQVTCPQGQPSASSERLHPARHPGGGGEVPRPGLPGLPGPRPVHHRQPRRTPAHLPAPRDPTGPRHRPHPAGHQRLAGKYALRAGVEGTIHQAVAVADIRHARYRGRKKVHLEHVLSAVALNLIRLDHWWNGHPLDRTRTSHLARLELTLAA